jgi:hypothetical protein
LRPRARGHPVSEQLSFAILVPSNPWTASLALCINLMQAAFQNAMEVLGLHNTAGTWVIRRSRSRRSRRAATGRFESMGIKMPGVGQQAAKCGSSRYENRRQLPAVRGLRWASRTTIHKTSNQALRELKRDSCSDPRGALTHSCLPAQRPAHTICGGSRARQESAGRAPSSRNLS